MKWIKLFESFDSEYDVNYIEDVCMSLNDYNLKLNDVKEGSAIQFPKDKNIITDSDDFDMSLSYESLILNIKPIEENFLINKESFYEDLDDIIYHMESKFNLKLECIFFNTGSCFYYKSLEYFKQDPVVRVMYSPQFGNLREKIRFIRLDIMFKKLNP
jgi:hypothetical protein